MTVMSSLKLNYTKIVRQTDPLLNVVIPIGYFVIFKGKDVKNGSLELDYSSRNDCM